MTNRKWTLLQIPVVCSLILLCNAAVGQSKEAAELQSPALIGDRYTFNADHDPNGIGKFYMGREIAHVMGYAGAIWLERDTREEEERLTLMVKSLQLKPGDVVADIGA